MFLTLAGEKCTTDCFLNFIFAILKTGVGSGDGAAYILPPFILFSLVLQDEITLLITKSSWRTG